MLVNINKTKYTVCDDEFPPVPHAEYNNLIILKNVGYFERISSLLSELIFNNIENLVVVSPNHGGFLPIECSKYFKNVFLYLTEYKHYLNISENILNLNIENVGISEDIYTLNNCVML